MVLTPFLINLLYSLRFSQTGEYLRPDDMRWCIEKTNFTEDQIADWFKRFKVDCPDGRLTRDHLRLLFRTAFPGGTLNVTDAILS